MHGKNFVRSTMHGRPFNSHNSYKCDEGKNTFGRKMFFCFFPLLISLCTRTQFIFSFLMHTHKVCVWKENKLFSFISYTRAHDLAFFLERYVVSCHHFPCHRHPLSVPPASIVRATSVQASPPEPQATGAHVSLTPLSLPPVPVFCCSHRRPCPPAPVDLLTTGVPYRFVAIKDIVLHSIRTLCFPSRRHPDILPA